MLTPEQLEAMVHAALDQFYKRRLASFDRLNLKKVLQRKNPYLFRAIGTNDPERFVSALLSAYLSSSDEGIFGDAFFEPVALGVSSGRKSITDSVDVELDAETLTRAYAVKSGLSVFNAQSRRRQIQAFEECRRRLPGRAFEAVVGYGYGQRSSPPGGKKNFREVSGQAFWEEISGDPDLYKRLLSIIGRKADDHAAAYERAFAEITKKFIAEFQSEFATSEGHIDWNKLLTFNSGKRVQKETTKRKRK